MAYFFSEKPTREPAFNAPLVVLITLGVVIAAHVGRLFLPAAMQEELFVRFFFIPARFQFDGGDPVAFVQAAITFVSYAFLQQDWMGFILNAVILLAFGTVIARRFGSAPFLLFFSICIVTAAVMHLASHWAMVTPLVGISGAATGLLAAGIRMLPLGNIYAFESERPLLPILSPQVLIFSAFVILSDVLAGQSNPTGWQATVGTYIAGLFLTDAFEVFAQRRAARLKAARSNLHKK